VTGVWRDSVRSQQSEKTDAVSRPAEVKVVKNCL
jgi:hypothetical protein